MGENPQFGHFSESSTGTIEVLRRISLLVIFGQVLPVQLRVLPVELLLCSQFRPVFVM